MPESPLPEALVADGPDFPDLSEGEVVRHYTRLSTWNYGVDTGFYPLGSCTMKYNPKTNERQAGLKGFAAAHPLLPTALSQGALRLMYELERDLAEITGLDAVTLQPAAGAQGELAGMLILGNMKPGNSLDLSSMPGIGAGENSGRRSSSPTRRTEQTRPAPPCAGTPPCRFRPTSGGSSPPGPWPP